jgi:leucyl aminopeptidase
MQVTFAPAADQAAILVMPVEKEELARLDLGDVRSLAEAAAQAARFTGEAGTAVDLFVPGEPVRHRILLGVGGGNESDWAKAGGALTARLLTSGATGASVDLAAVSTTPAAVARFAAAAAQRAWRHDVYRTKLPDNQKPSLATLTIVGAPDGIDAAWLAQSAVTDGMALTRQLVSEPPNILYPESFVEQVTASVEGLGLEVTVLDTAAMTDLGMGALLGVAQGSSRPGKLLALKWNGAGEGTPAVALVGKGVTFDTGGISIKPAAGMEDMKWDMGGAGAVAGADEALATRKAKANVIGVMGLVENMPDGNATRPGDILVSMSGQTIEVLNTDAEGRLVLADAITWVQRTHGVKTIVDLGDADRRDDRGTGQRAWRAVLERRRSRRATDRCRPRHRGQAVALSALVRLRQDDRQPDRRHEEHRR